MTFAIWLGITLIVVAVMFWAINRFPEWAFQDEDEHEQGGIG